MNENMNIDELIEMAENIVVVLKKDKGLLKNAEPFKSAVSSLKTTKEYLLKNDLEDKRIEKITFMIEELNDVMRGDINE